MVHGWKRRMESAYKIHAIDTNDNIAHNDYLHRFVSYEYQRQRSVAIDAKRRE